MSAEWYDLGLQLKVKPGKLDNIQAEFSALKHQLREMLKAWLKTGDNPSWKTLIDALKSPLVGESRLATVLEAKYCPVQRTELDIRGHSETDVFIPSPVSEPLHGVISQQTDTLDRMGK